MLDLIIRQGNVIDPTQGINEKLDIGIRRGRIDSIEKSIPTSSAAHSVDATGRLVTPGLIDLHSHVYHGFTSGGIDPDPIAADTGVTTWIDAGSAGAYTLPGLREYVASSAKVRIYAFVNISCIGLVAHDHELANLEYCSVDLLNRVVAQERDFVVGVKYRAGRSGGARDLEPLKRAKQASETIGLPLLVHLSRQPPTLDEVLEHLSPGDILTHTFTALDMKIIDDEGSVLESVHRARDAGVLMDIGHGSGSFSWESAEALGKQGFWPDTISTDIHQKSVHGQYQRGYLATGTGPYSSLDAASDATKMIFTYHQASDRPFNLLDCMSKLLHVGMPLDEVIRAVTQTPAKAVGLDSEIGSLKRGMRADVAILDLIRGEFDLHDSQGVPRVAKEAFSRGTAIIGGRVLQAPVDRRGVPWVVPIDAP